MATVVKNFRIKSGLIVEGATGTIGGQNILTETGGDNYILNLVGGATLVKSVDTAVFNVDGSGKLTVNANTFDSYGSASAAQTAAATDATNKANQALSDAQSYSNSLASNYDAAGSAAAAQTAAESYANGLAVNYDAVGSAATAEQNAKDYADNKINDASSASDKVWSAYKTSTEIGLAQAAAEAHADAAVANIVGLAPQALDTLEELATALENNPDIIANLESVAAGKQDALTAGSNIDITGSIISVTGLDAADISDFNSAALSATSAAYDIAGSASAAQLAAEIFATTAANNAQSAAEATAALDATSKANAAQSAAEATAQAALDNVLDATTPFTDLNINDVAKQVAARTTSLGSVAVTAYQFNKSAFKSGKFLVKIDNGTHNEISEILVTLDSSDNVAITEYAIVGTNGTRGTITADVDATHCRIRVNPVNDSTITVSGTVFNS
jgi:hypothetical protein